MSPTQKIKPSKGTVARNNPPHNSYKRISLIFISLAILLILAISYIALPKVTITLTPTDKPITHKFNLQIDSADSHITDTDKKIPVLTGKIIIKNIDFDQTFPVSQGQTVDSIAKGTVTLYNQRSSAQTLVATTRLLTPDNILFRLTKKVTIPANSSLVAKVYADQAGAQGNIGPSTFIIPGLSPALQKIVYAKSEQAMSGGTKKIGVLTQTDIDQAKKKAGQQAAADMLSKYIDNPDKLTLIGTQIDSHNLQSDKKIGDKIDNFNLTGQIVVSAVFADKSRLLEIAKSQLKNSQSDEKKSISLDPSSLNFQLVSLNQNPLSATVEVSISGLATFNAQQDMFDKSILVGFTAEDLKLYFSQFDSIQDVQVKFSPFWVKKVPILKDHIKIQIKK